MPFDGKPEAFETKPDDVSTLPPEHPLRLARWLETQDPLTTYNFRDIHGDCLLGRYARALNKRRPWWKRLLLIERVNWATLNFGERTDLGDIAVRRPWTYEAAHARALKVARAHV